VRKKQVLSREGFLSFANVNCNVIHINDPTCHEVQAGVIASGGSCGRI
jgi:hypothetical protein